ncbi:MAG: hypothetical protein AAGD25_09805 [Cyanobacteria bacterium P01_F01_bin.150]
MTDPITATVIASIAFKALTETLSKKLGETVYLQVSKQVKKLRSLIAKRFTGNTKAELALAKAENGSDEGLAEVAKILQPVIDADPEYGKELRTLTQEIQQQINIDNSQGKSICINNGSGTLINNPEAPVFQEVKGNVNISY